MRSKIQRISGQPDMKMTIYTDITSDIRKSELAGTVKIITERAVSTSGSRGDQVTAAIPQSPW